ncbi:MAG: polyphenol oxidase family protein, partial [Actinobacteria bacterium]|nr:polyphenol oxidase family protein [Actinomycetota bacterium]
MGARFTLEWREAEGLTWLQWEGAGVAAAFPTREGGVSPAPFASLNLGLSVDDGPANVLENRRRLCTALGLPQGRLVVPGQVHGTKLAWVGEAEAGRGAIDRETVLHDHDGLLTATPGLGLAVSYADCVPVAIVAGGADGPELAAVHAGWRGMLAGIVGQAA